MDHIVVTVWYKMSNCFHVCNKMLEQSVPYVVLNGYDPGCTSYNTNMYHMHMSHEAKNGSSGQAVHNAMEVISSAAQSLC